MKKFFLLNFFLFASIAFGQLIEPEDPVRITFVPAEKARSGQLVEAKLLLDIKKDWHIFSEKPGLDGITPSTVKLEPSDQYSVEKVIFPPAKTEYSEIFDRKLAFYEGQIAVSIVLKLKKGIAGEIPMKGEFKYQACSNNLCLPPAKQKISATMKVTG